MRKIIKVFLFSFLLTLFFSITVFGATTQYSDMSKPIIPANMQFLVNNPLWEQITYKYVYTDSGVTTTSYYTAFIPNVPSNLVYPQLYYTLPYTYLKWGTGSSNYYYVSSIYHSELNHNFMQYFNSDIGTYPISLSSQSFISMCSNDVTSNSWYSSTCTVYNSNGSVNHGLSNTASSTNFDAYSTGSYTGLLITNPFDGASVKNPVINFTAHARIQASVGLDIDLNTDSITGRKSDIVKMLVDNFGVSLNSAIQNVQPIVTFDSFQSSTMNSASYYNVTLKFALTLSSAGTNTITVSDRFMTGGYIDGTFGNKFPYSILTNTVSYDYAPVVVPPVIVTDSDGNTSTTVTNPDGSTSTTTTTKDGVITNSPPVLADYSGLIGKLQYALDTVVYFIKLPYTIVSNFLNTLLNAFTDLTVSINSIIPWITKLFSFFPPPINSLIIAIISLMCIGVFFKLFGK